MLSDLQSVVQKDEEKEFQYYSKPPIPSTSEANDMTDNKHKNVLLTDDKHGTDSNN
jgi:hypothetical protein